MTVQALLMSSEFTGYVRSSKELSEMLNNHLQSSEGSSCLLIESKKSNLLKATHTAEIEQHFERATFIDESGADNLLSQTSIDPLPEI